MSIDELLRRARPVMEEFPLGMPVWHRASGNRAVVVEYCINASGCVMVTCDYGGNWNKELPCSLSGSRVGSNTDGDEWKEGATA